MITLPPVPEDGNNPRIGWRNLVTAANIEAGSEAAGFPAVNLANPTTFQLWRAAAIGSVNLTMTLSELTPIDYVGIARHNFGSAGISYSLQGTTNGSTWNDLDVALLPADDGIIVHEFEETDLLGIRVVLGAGSAAAQAAVLYAGTITRLQRRIYVGHTPIPYGRKTSVSTGMSESGQYLGRVTRRKEYRTSIRLQNLTPEWYREELAPFDDVAAIRAFFWAWRPETYPNEVAYCWTGEDPEVTNQRANGMMEWQVNAQGVIV